MRPVRRLEAGTRKISSGDYDVNIPVMSRDEIGDLTAAFNEMSRNLAIKEELLNEQRRENNRLLLALMPESVVQRYREGEATIAQKHQDVTIIFADIVGLDEISNDAVRATNWSRSSTNCSGSSTRRPKPLASNGFAPSTTAISPAAG